MNSELNFWPGHLGSVTMRFQGGGMGVREYIQGRRCRFQPAQIHKYTIKHKYTITQIYIYTKIHSVLESTYKEGGAG